VILELVVSIAIVACGEPTVGVLHELLVSLCWLFLEHCVVRLPSDEFTGGFGPVVLVL
jgi:hypothetical protein